MKRLIAGILSATLAGLIALSSHGVPAHAVSPEAIQQGRQLFEQDWPTVHPSTGRDGLGPLFNARSCVACHHQGGVGGGGDSRFNANTIAIDGFKASGNIALRSMNNQQFAAIFAGFHPGFVNNSADISSSFALAHHGGSTEYAQRRGSILAGIQAAFSDQGGPLTAAEVRRTIASPILARQQFSADPGNALVIRARLYQRNTTSLFGAGLIDRIREQELKQLAHRQQAHPEISGRVLGRFGWRGNASTLFEFCDQACANELGLQTDRSLQANDPTRRDYRQISADISDSMVASLTAFVAALPAPVRDLPTESDQLQQVQRGETLFASVGCAVCHVPDVGPAKGIYSDILLHDMGAELYDPNQAPSTLEFQPAVNTIVGTRSASRAKVQRTVTKKKSVTGSSAKANIIQNRQSARSAVDQYVNRAKSAAKQQASAAQQANKSTRTRATAATASRSRSARSQSSTSTGPVVRRRSSRPTSQSLSSYYGGNTPLRFNDMISDGSGEFIRPPLVANREWRTPPLWGVRDSAPYMHDGRAGTLLEAISLHEGEARGTRDRFLDLPLDDRRAIVAFLETLVAPPHALPAAIEKR